MLICDAIKMAWVKPLAMKSEVADEIEKAIKEIRAEYNLGPDHRVFAFLRRDNEPVLNTPAMAKVLQSLGVCDAPSVPYNPEMNSTVERYMRTLFDALRVNLINVDHRLWCYCAEYVAQCWARIPHDYDKMPQHNGKTPIEILEEKSGRNSSKSADLLRRFGSLMYFKRQVDEKDKEKEKGKKLKTRWLRGVFLGLCPKSLG